MAAGITKVNQSIRSKKGREGIRRAASSTGVLQPATPPPDWASAVIVVRTHFTDTGVTGFVSRFGDQPTIRAREQRVFFWS